LSAQETAAGLDETVAVAARAGLLEPLSGANNVEGERRVSMAAAGALGGGGEESRWLVRAEIAGGVLLRPFGLDCDWVAGILEPDKVRCQLGQ